MQPSELMRMTAGESQALARGIAHWLKEEDRRQAELAKATGGRVGL